MNKIDCFLEYWKFFGDTNTFLLAMDDGVNGCVLESELRRIEVASVNFIVRV